MAGLDGAVVLVTGATGEVGWGIAHAARDAGARLVLPTRSAARVDEIEAEFPGAHVVVTDLGSDGADQAIAGAIAAVGSLDHVVAPIGSWWQGGRSLDQHSSELSTLLDTYVGAQFRLARATAPSLRDSNGSYTIVTGAAGESMLPGAGLLVVAVRAQYALSEVLRSEQADDEFRVNEVRIHTRIERAERSGVTPSRQAGDAFVDVMLGQDRGRIIALPGA